MLAFSYTSLYNRRGSVLLCILLHANFTPSQEHLILLPNGILQVGGGINTIDLVIFGTYGAAVLPLVLVTRGALVT